MRISANREDAGYPLYRALPKCVAAVVRLNGQIVNNCITACDRTGYVLVVVTDDQGHLVINAARDAAKREIRRGLVTIELVRR